jgi:hypothetical protein
MDIYVESVTDFIDEWEETKTRFNGAGFETKFLRTYDVFIAVARALGPLESSRTRGLLPKRFQMRARFSLHSFLAVPSASGTSATEAGTKAPSRPKDLVPTE